MKMLSTVGAGCLVIESDQVLLVQPNYGPAKGQWMFPGGFINDNESPEDAALRELWEETGQVGKVIPPLCIRYRQAPTDIYWVFQVELTLNTPISVLTSELLDVRFWPVKEAIHSPLVRPMSRFFLESALAPPLSNVPLPRGHDDTHRVFFFEPSDFHHAQVHYQRNERLAQ
ncbi:MAG: NUDIX hydrolase [Bdellovibrionaceae bacterium]|nr:NUDIX hydrolase [Bdellovibrionales bacterium]MCB9085680.1 NUDIX hydrolase [Pseudobdellovibrionaceae bacterium]